MQLSTFERRRIAVAAIITILVLPLLLMNRGNNDSADSTVAVTTTTQFGSGLGTESEDGSLEPIILGGPSPIVQDGSAQIAYPASNLAGIQVIASYSNFDNAPNVVCYLPQAPLGIKITLQNLNNARTASCTNVFRTSLPSGVTMLLHTKVFESLANIVDAPIPVVASW